MFLRILLCFFINLVFSGACIAANQAWSPKASDTCEQFVADLNNQASIKPPMYDRYAQQPKLLKYLWGDSALLNLNKAIEVLHSEDKNFPYTSDDETTKSLRTLIDIGFYCENHLATLLVDIRAQDVINESNIPVASPNHAQQPSKVVSLNCSMNALSFDGMTIPEMQIALTIDYTNSTVNGYRAQFYENEIRWESQSKSNSNFNNTLNRLSGFYSYGDDQFAVLRSGHCAPATRQF